MKAPDFDYQRPSDLEAALNLLSAHRGEAQPIAGGQSLMPMMNFRAAAPSMLIDLADLGELRGVTLDEGTLRIGAMTTYADLAHDPRVAAAAPLVALALPHIAHDAIRNRGTIGGSLALADPAAEMPAVALALGARIEVAGPGGRRMIPADEFFAGYFETALAEDELIVAVRVGEAGDGQSVGFHELTRRHGDYALAGAAVVRSDGAHRVAFFGVADRPLRVPGLEAALDAGDDPLPHMKGIEFASDIKASAETRQQLAGVALKRAMEGMDR